MASLQLLAIKPKTWRDLVNDEPFKREDIITIQDPQNLAARDLREYDYVKKDLKVSGMSRLFSLLFSPFSTRFGLEECFADDGLFFCDGWCRG